MKRAKIGKRAKVQRKKKIENNKDAEISPKSLESKDNNLEDSSASKLSTTESFEKNIELGNTTDSGKKDDKSTVPPSHPPSMINGVFKKGPRTPPGSPPRTRRIRFNPDSLPAHFRGPHTPSNSPPRVRRSSRITPGSQPMVWRGPHTPSNSPPMSRRGSRTPSNSPPMLRRGPRTPSNSPPVARRVG